MLPPFDIFRVGPGDVLRWIESSCSLDQAKQRVEQIMRSPSSSGDYVIFDQRNGSKLSLKSGALDKPRSKN